MLRKWRVGRLHARSWNYDPNPALFSFLPTPKPSVMLCGSVPVLAAVLIVMGHLVLKSLFKRGESLPRCDSCRLVLSLRLEITAYDIGAESGEGEGRMFSGFLLEL